jgi:anti-sigma factor RsiW
MTSAWNPGPRPTAEDLMAFADGELDPARHEEVAAWLAAHPEAAAEIEDFRRLGRVWQTAAPQEPSPETWTAALVRIETRLPPARRPSPAGFRRPVWTFTGLAAAAVLGLLLWGQSFKPEGSSGTAGVAPADDEPFPVAAAHEINIVYMQARDADALVGHPPLSENLEFASNADVQLLNIAPHGPNGRRARMEAGAVPLIVAGRAGDP